MKSLQQTSLTIQNFQHYQIRKTGSKVLVIFPHFFEIQQPMRIGTISLIRHLHISTPSTNIGGPSKTPSPEGPGAIVATHKPHVSIHEKLLLKTSGPRAPLQISPRIRAEVFQWERTQIKDSFTRKDHFPDHFRDHIRHCHREDKIAMSTRENSTSLELGTPVLLGVLRLRRMAMPELRLEVQPSYESFLSILPSPPSMETSFR